MLKEAELHDALNDLVGISTRVPRQTAQEDSSGSSDSSESSDDRSKSSDTRERSDSSESSDDGSEGVHPGFDLDEHSFSQSDLEYAVELVGGAGVGATYAAKRARVWIWK